MSNRSSDSGRQAVIWLATVIVFVIGAAGSAFVIIASTEQTEVPFMIWGGSFAGIGLILYLMNMNWSQGSEQLKFWLSFQDRRDPADDYRAARRSIEMREEYGNNQPPSVDSVRDAASYGGAWAPHSSASSSRRRNS